MAIIVQDYGTVGGGTPELQNTTASLVGNTWVDVGIKASETTMISLECISLYATFGKDTSDNWNVLFGGYFAIQVNASGNIEIKLTTYSGTATIYYA